VFGICQGFETIHLIANNDDLNTFTGNSIYFESRPVDWAVENPKQNSKMFQSFPLSLLNKLESENLAFHAHDWVIDIKTYQ